MDRLTALADELKAESDSRKPRWDEGLFVGGILYHLATAVKHGEVGSLAAVVREWAVSLMTEIRRFS